jgi:SAM-dependent MidA family methyltransferase
METIDLDGAGTPELIERITAAIRANGRITFADFMRMALYEPDLGYYMTPAVRSGRSGDYFTSPELHPLFGQLVGRQLVEMVECFGDNLVTIIEMGAGRGLLAEDVLSVCEQSWPGWPKRLRYVVIDVSPRLIERQQERLSRFVSAGADVRWCRTLSEAAPPGGLTGIIFSNELVDAFPVHRVVMRQGTLFERYVTLDGDRLIEQEDRPSTPALPAYFDQAGIVLPEGFATEVNLDAIEWMTTVGRTLRTGFVLTIDYGHAAEERYAPPRRLGTLACYAGHRRSETPYERIGRQDITSHVDFSALARAGRAAGLELTGLTDQASFLMGLGGAEAMEERLSQAAGVQREVELAAFQTLLAPEGMGRVFKVLIQHKGVPAPRLRGLSFRPFFVPPSLHSMGGPP